MCMYLTPERPRSISNDDWWQLSEHQEDSTKHKGIKVIYSVVVLAS